MASKIEVVRPKAAAAPGRCFTACQLGWWHVVLAWVAHWYHVFWSRDQGRLVAGKPRSGKWQAVEKAFLKRHPRCAVCASVKAVNVHHLVPYHKRSDLELDPLNLITLCRDHHLTFGHLGSWKSWNKMLRIDARLWRAKIRRRPKG
jgi:hypothetical protein